MRWLLFSGLLAASGAQSAERMFPLTWDSVLVAPGKNELQVQVAPHVFRTTEESYLRMGLKLLLTKGVAAQVETAFGAEADLESFGTDSHRADPRVTNVWRYALLPREDVVGVTVMGRFSLGLDVLELEGRVAVDKRFGALALAANASLSRLEYWNSRTGVDTRLEQSAAVGYQASPSVCAGVELLFHESFLRGVYQGTGIYIGPSVSWNTPRWWLAVGVYGQVAANKAVADRGNGEPLEVRDNERFVGQLSVGFKAD